MTDESIFFIFYFAQQRRLDISFELLLCRNNSYEMSNPIFLKNEKVLYAMKYLSLSTILSVFILNIGTI